MKTNIIKLVLTAVAIATVGIIGTGCANMSGHLVEATAFKRNPVGESEVGIGVGPKFGGNVGQGSSSHHAAASAQTQAAPEPTQVPGRYVAIPNGVKAPRGSVETTNQVMIAQ